MLTKTQIQAIRKLTIEADEFLNGEGDAMTLDDAIIEVEKILKELDTWNSRNDN
jgi:hypothetical protein